MRKHLLKFGCVVIAASVIPGCSTGGGSGPSGSGLLNDLNGAAGATTLICELAGMPTTPWQAAAYALYGTISGIAASGRTTAPEALSSYAWPSTFNDTVNLQRLESIAGDPSNQYDIGGKVHNKILNDYYKTRPGTGRPTSLLNTDAVKNYIFDYIKNDTINSYYGFTEKNRQENINKLNVLLREGVTYQNDNLQTQEQFQQRFNGIVSRASGPGNCIPLLTGLNRVSVAASRTFESGYNITDLLRETSEEVQKINNGEYGLDMNNKAVALTLISVFRHSAVYWDAVEKSQH